MSAPTADQMARGRHHVRLVYAPHQAARWWSSELLLDGLVIDVR